MIRQLEIIIIASAAQSSGRPNGIRCDWAAGETFGEAQASSWWDAMQRASQWPPESRVCLAPIRSGDTAAEGDGDWHRNNDPSHIVAYVAYSACATRGLLYARRCPVRVVVLSSRDCLQSALPRWSRRPRIDKRQFRQGTNGGAPSPSQGSIIASVTCILLHCSDAVGCSRALFAHSPSPAARDVRRIRPSGSVGPVGRARQPVFAG